MLIYRPKTVPNYIDHKHSQQRPAHSMTPVQYSILVRAYRFVCLRSKYEEEKAE